MFAVVLWSIHALTFVYFKSSLLGVISCISIIIQLLQFERENVSKYALRTLLCSVQLIFYFWHPVVWKYFVVIGIATPVVAKHFVNSSIDADVVDGTYCLVSSSEHAFESWFVCEGFCVQFLFQCIIRCCVFTILICYRMIWCCIQRGMEVLQRTLSQLLIYYTRLTGAEGVLMKAGPESAELCKEAISHPAFIYEIKMKLKL